MSLDHHAFDNMQIPAIGAPLFIISNPKLVVAQCKAGIIGAFPSLNARPIEQLDEWLAQIVEELSSGDFASFAVNQIVHKSNDRLMADLELCVKHKAPIVITSLGAVEEVNQAVHSYGGIVLHDIINDRHAHKAIEKGADGLIAVAAGAGGHAGTFSPFALIHEIRQWFDGPLFLSGSIATGGSVLAAQAMGADGGYIGSAFIATDEARATPEYKQGVVDGRAGDIVNTNLFTGIHGNYLKASIIIAGMDPYDLPESDPSKMNFGSGGGSKAKAWKDIWGCGQGIGAIDQVMPAATLVERLVTEYEAARSRLV